MKQTTFSRLLIALSLLITAFSWYQIETLGIFFLPVVGIPAFTLAAYSTKFLEVKNKTLGIFLTLLGVIASIYAFFIAWAGTASQAPDLFGSTTQVPSVARVTSLVAALLFVAGITGLWQHYLASRKRSP